MHVSVVETMPFFASSYVVDGNVIESGTEEFQACQDFTTDGL